MSPLLQTLLTAVVTLGAAFFGAGYAFRLNDKARARQTERDHVAAVNRAIFVLVRQFNTLTAIQNQIINPSRQDPARFIGMRPFLPVAGRSPTLDLDELSFLLETDHRNFVMEFLLEEERFETAIQAMKERSRLHIDVLQPKMAAAGVMEKVDYPADYIVSVLGEPFILHMKRATDAAISHVDESIESNRALSERFHIEMKQLFPGHSIIRFEPKVASNNRVEEDAA